MVLVSGVCRLSLVAGDNPSAGHRPCGTFAFTQSYLYANTGLKANDMKVLIKGNNNNNNCFEIVNMAFGGLRMLL